MARRFVICPLCGFEFESEDTLCQHGCPMRTACDLTRCPSCDYEFPEEPRKASWLRRLLRREAPAPVERCELFLTVEELESGQRATVVSLSGRPAGRNSLAVFGLVPGTEVTLLQRRPAFVLRVGETELALDAEVARRIVVRRAGEPEGPARASL